MIPREVLFYSGSTYALDLDASGSQVLFVKFDDGRPNLWIADSHDFDGARQVTDDRDRGISSGQFAGGGRWLLYEQDRDGDEETHVFRVDPRTGERVDLTPFENGSAGIAAISRSAPWRTAIHANDKDQSRYDLLSIDVETGESERIAVGGGLDSWILDDEARFHVGTRLTSTGAREWVIPSTRRGWQVIFDVGTEDASLTELLWVSADGARGYLASSVGRPAAALFEIDLTVGTLGDVLVESERASVDGVWVPAGAEKAAAAHVDGLIPHWVVLDPRYQADFDALSAIGDGVFSIVDDSDDGSRWLVYAENDDGSSQFLLHDVASHRATHLVTTQPSLDGLELSPMHTVTIPARDGLPLPTYLSLPAGTDPDGDGRPDEPLPMVLYVHGGPWERERWGFHPFHQWLADRGYAVLAPNFRSSAGFTKTLYNAGFGEWGAKMHDDLIDAVRWAVGRGIADENRVAIFGASYGGYATLVGLTKTPETFACGVDLVGFSSIETWIESFPPKWKMFLDQIKVRVGDFTTPRGRAELRKRSPLHSANQIVKPLLISHGANDPRVKQSESDAIVASLVEHGIPVTYLVYPDEGHSFSRHGNLVAFAAVAEAFLARCLSGRALPIGDDLEGSSVQVREGASHIPGLADALKGR